MELHSAGPADAELLGALLDLSARGATSGRTLRLTELPVGVLVIGAALLLWWMADQLGAALIPLLVLPAAGAGITFWSGLELDAEERLAYGMLIGAGAFTLLLLGLGLIMGFGLATVCAALILVAAAGAAGFATHRADAAAAVAAARERWLADPRTPGHPWPLLAVLAVAWPYAVHLLSQVYVQQADGLYAGYVNVWGDWGAHLAYAGSFAYGQNFPPELPVDPGNHFLYPFMADLLSASLVPFGSSLPSALVQGSGYLGLAFPAVMYLAGRRLIGGRLAPALAVFVFAASGGIGFVYWFQALSQHGLAALQHIPREYTLDRDLNFQWLDPVLAYLLPQRSTLFGFGLVLVVMALLISAREVRSWVPYAFAGVIAGATPWFHVPAYGTMIALALFWVLFDRRRHWLAFFVPALAFGLPALAWLWPPGATPLRLQLGWMAGMDGHHDNPLAFWFLNLGLFIPVLLVAQFWKAVPLGAFRWRFAPLWLWFLVPNAVLLTMWEWDNTKFFIFWALFGAFLVAALVAHLMQRGAVGRVGGGALLVLLCLSGLLDQARATDLSQNKFQFVDSNGQQVAAWVRANTPARAIFLTSTNHNEPVAALGGRRVVLGYPGWLWTYQITDFYRKENDVNTMLQGGPGAAALAQRYHVAYVVIGPQELGQPFQASLGFWRDHGSVVYNNGEYTVFRVSAG
ncbi:MAG TPA: hypothetical protein VF137_04630 [Candidatus Dormibacteraeota bacterium]